MNIEFVFALNVFDVFLNLREVRSERGPTLRSDDGPQVDTSCLETAGRNERSMWMPLLSISQTVHLSLNSGQPLLHRALLLALLKS